MVKVGKIRVKGQEIGKIMNKSANYLAVYRGKLIDDQVIKPNGCTALVITAVLALNFTPKRKIKKTENK